MDQVKLQEVEHLPLWHTMPHCPHADLTHENVLLRVKQVSPVFLALGLPKC